MLTLAFDRTNTTYNLTGRAAGSGVIALSGGVDYAVPAHFISVRISDPRITVAAPSDDRDGQRRRLCDPYETTGAQIVNPTTPTRVDVYTLTLSGSGVFSGTTSRHHVDERSRGPHGCRRERLQRRDKRLLQNGRPVRHVLVLGHDLIR